MEPATISIIVFIISAIISAIFAVIINFDKIKAFSIKNIYLSTAYLKFLETFAKFNKNENNKDEKFLLELKERFLQLSDKEKIKVNKILQKCIINRFYNNSNDTGCLGVGESLNGEIDEVEISKKFYHNVYEKFSIIIKPYQPNYRLNYINSLDNFIKEFLKSPKNFFLNDIFRNFISESLNRNTFKGSIKNAFTQSRYQIKLFDNDDIINFDKLKYCIINDKRSEIDFNKKFLSRDEAKQYLLMLYYGFEFLDHKNEIYYKSEFEKYNELVMLRIINACNPADQLIEIMFDIVKV